MELILISNTKLKVMLSASDMQKYELDNNSIDYDNTETRKAFWQILDEAKHKTGFDAASDKVFIQVYPSRGGGCEMYVTKLGGARCEDQGAEPPAHKKQFSLLVQLFLVPRQHLLPQHPLPRFSSSYRST